jgi:hypothetical protein
MLKNVFHHPEFNNVHRFWDTFVRANISVLQLYRLEDEKCRKMSKLLLWDWNRSHFIMIFDFYGHLSMVFLSILSLKS